MHSRIFQMTEAVKDKKDYIKPSDYYDHWFTSSVADYVSEAGEREEEIQDWLSDIKGCRIEREGKRFVFLVEDKKAFFKQKYEGFVFRLNKLTEYSFEDFCEGNAGMSSMMWHLNNCYSGGFELYIEDSGEWEGVQTLEKFIRRAEEGKRYYIGGVVDYHY